MSLRMEEEHVDGKKMEFDILIDGAYQKRVSRGLLFEDTATGGVMLVSCPKTTVFKAIHSLEKWLDNTDSKEEYEEFKRFMSLTPSEALDEVIKKLDDILGKEEK